MSFFIIATFGPKLQRMLHCRSRKSSSRKGPSPAASEVDPDMPEHDLEPPKFSRRALERLLYDWNAVKAMVATGQKVCGVDALGFGMGIGNPYHS